MEVHFGSHPLARSVLGSLDSVGALTVEQMRAYFQHRYSPSNMLLAAAGNVNFESLVARAEQYCGGWQQFDAPRHAPRAGASSQFVVVPKESATQQYTSQIANGPGAEDEDRFASRLMTVIVGDDSGSRLYWELVETGLAEYAALGAYELQGTGLLMTFHCSAPEQTAENLQRIHDIQLAVERDGVSDDELERAKSKICSHIVLQGERTTSRLFSVGMNWLVRREYRTTRELVAEYQAVTRDDIAAVLRKYPLSVNTTVTIGPLTDVAAPR
jgi:predicted Zn-dependent peptidase